MTYDMEYVEKIDAERGNIKSVAAYAICDNDGGRLITPVPLVRLIFATEHEAKQAAQLGKYPEEYYPIRKIVIRRAE